MESKKADDALKRVLRIMDSAKEEPSDVCLDGKEHAFRCVVHAVDSIYSKYYYRCDHCNEVICDKVERRIR